MSDSFGTQWTALIVLTALLLSLTVLVQIASRYASAYFGAPREVASFIDVADSSIAENESYERDVGKVARLEDKVRLGRLLREIQSGSDDIREALNALVVGEDDTRLRTGARILWAAKRAQLEERVRRLDLLRMRFLVVYMGIITAGAEGVQKHVTPVKDPEKAANRDVVAMRLGAQRALTEAIRQQKPPMRRLTTQAIGHQERVGGAHRMGWAGVVQELQKSPLMHKRHASIEGAMSPQSP
jgi:hypothetical protein